jgi:hypothetical protein
MRYLLLAAFCLVSFYPPVWARDLNATEKEMAGSWIETSRYSDRMELFEDGTGKGVLGDSFEWKILADNRLKVDAPVFGGLKISTSESVDLREGFFYLDGREFIRYDPALETTYIELSRAVEAAGAGQEAVMHVQSSLESLNSLSSLDAHILDYFRKAVPAVERASSECLERVGNALRRSPGFARAHLVETECRYPDLKSLELQGEAHGRYPKGLGKLSGRQGFGETWMSLISLGRLTVQLANAEPSISYWTTDLNRNRQELEALEGTGPSERGRGKNAAKQRSERIAYLKRSIADNQEVIDEHEQKAKIIRAEIDRKGAALAATLAKQKKDQLESILAAYAQALAAGLPPPRKAETLNSLAWTYATTDVPELSDGTKAVNYAKQALALFPRSPTYTGTLAAAYARAGDFAQAAQVQQQAIDLLSPASSQDKERTTQQGRLDLYRQGKPIGGPSPSP